MKIEIKGGDRLVLRTPDGESAFTATEYETAMHFAKLAARRGRATLVAHLDRPRAKNKVTAVVLWSDKMQRQELPPVRKVPGKIRRLPVEEETAVA